MGRGRMLEAGAPCPTSLPFPAPSGAMRAGTSNGGKGRSYNGGASAGLEANASLEKPGRACPFPPLLFWTFLSLLCLCHPASMAPRELGREEVGCWARRPQPPSLPPNIHPFPPPPAVWGWGKKRRKALGRWGGGTSKPSRSGGGWAPRVLFLPGPFLRPQMGGAR